MKRLFLFLTALVLGLCATAQTQQGYVKTKGRMVNGQLVPGQGLKGATVSIKGRTAVMVNADDGAFSFPVTEQQFRVDSVKKKGYELVDAEACQRTYKPSANPLYLVMETPEQQLQDKLTAERRIRRNLQKQLQEKEDELEDLKEQNKITLEEYQKALQQIYEEQMSNEQLISDMAKRYSELDYDQLDEFYRQVSYHIENGELMKADSMLRTRGNINAQVNDIIQRGQALQEEKEQLKKAETVHEADVQEASRRCYSYYETYYLQHQNDSAVHYLILRAQLDTTNVEAQTEAGKYLVEFMTDFTAAAPYYQTALRQSLLQYGENSVQTATLYENIGMVYYYQNDFETALEYFKKSMAIRINLFGPNHPEVAIGYNSIGLIHANRIEYDSALYYFNKALEIRKAAYGEEHFDVAATYNNIGYIYSAQGDYETALEYQNKALDIKIKCMGEDNPSIAIAHANIGSIYLYMKNYEKASYHLNKALEINKATLGENHPNTATSYGNVGMVYSHQGDYATALKYFQEALAIDQRTLGDNNLTAAAKYINLGTCYSNMGEYEKTLENYNKVLTIYKNILGEDHPKTKKVEKSIETVKEKMKEQ